MASVTPECAGAQGAFGAYVEAIFAKQDSLGLRSWTAWAVDAGVQDTVRYNACLKGDAGEARIASGKEMALKLGVRGTPGIMVNGWLFPSPPSDSALRTIIRRARAEVEHQQRS